MLSLQIAPPVRNPASSFPLGTSLGAVIPFVGGPRTKAFPGSNHRKAANLMTLRSALQDLRQTTLAAVSGLLAKLAYLASLRRREGGYMHWGLSLVHGEEASDRALKTAHSEALSAVLRTPISDLTEDLRQSSQQSDQTAGAYVEGMREQFHDLVPASQDEASARHLNSVLTALSKLEQNQKRATPSTS
jgi:hypothetical protein